MKQLLKADFYRLKLSKSYWTGLVIILLMTIFGAYMVRNMLNTTNEVNTTTTITEDTYLKQYLFQSIYNYPSAYEGTPAMNVEKDLPIIKKNKADFFVNFMQNDTLTVSIFYLVVVTGFLYGDFASKSMKNTLLYTGSRWIYYAEKWLFGALITFSAVAFYHLTTTFIYPLFFQESPFNLGLLIRTFRIILAQFPLYLAFHSFAFSLFFLVYKRWVTILITGFISILFPIYLATISNQIPVLRQFNPFNVFTTIAYFSKESMLTVPNLCYGISVGLLYSLIFLTLGWYGFTKFEIKK